jgi:hypothetical protein
MRQSLVTACFACVVLALPGCTPKMVKVSGKLVRNGQVVTFSEETYVTVQFIPVDLQAGRKSFAATVNRPEGTYEVHLPPGKYRLSLLVPPKDYDQSKGGSLPPPGGGGEGGPEFEFKSDTVQDITVP